MTKDTHTSTQLITSLRHPLTSKCNYQVLNVDARSQCGSNTAEDESEPSVVAFLLVGKS